MIIELEHLVLTRALSVIDLETTGTDVREDRIVEVAALTVYPGGKTVPFVQRVHPGRPIPAGASAVHAIRDADVAGAPAFAAIAPDLFAALVGSDIAGFGIANFDVPILVHEFARVGLPFRVGGRAILDALVVFRRHEPRDLTAAVRHYLGAERASAHAALADAKYALAVLDAQVGRYGLPRDPAELHATVAEVDVGGAFRRDPAGVVVFGFGKYRGRPLAQIASEDAGYLRWILRQAFLDDALALVRAALAATGTGAK